MMFRKFKNSFTRVHTISRLRDSLFFGLLISVLPIAALADQEYPGLGASYATEKEASEVIVYLNTYFSHIESGILKNGCTPGKTHPASIRENHFLYYKTQTALGTRWIPYLDYQYTHYYAAKTQFGREHNVTTCESKLYETSESGFIMNRCIAPNGSAITYQSQQSSTFMSQAPVFKQTLNTVTDQLYLWIPGTLKLTTKQYRVSPNCALPLVEISRTEDDLSGWAFNLPW